MNVAQLPIKIFGGLLFGCSAIAIVASGLSNALEKQNPALAATFNPFNVQAKINEISVRLAEKNLDEKVLASLLGKTKRIIDLSPQDGRGYSLLGEIRYRQKQEANANALFIKALTIAPTEVNALVHRINFTLKNGQIDSAIEYLDTLLRRWPKTLKAIAKSVIALARDKSASQLLSDKMMENPPWRGAVITVLSRDIGGLGFLQKFLLREKSIGKPVSMPTIAEVTQQLIKLKQYSAAYRTFIFTLSQKERKALGFVFNSDFSLAPDYRPFNWRIVEAGDADIEFSVQRDNGATGGATVGFRDVPTKLGNLYQYIFLPSGRYQMTTNVSARQLKTPKKLFWQLYCLSGIGELVRLPVPEGSFSNQRLTVKFEVPAIKCPIQLVRLKTDLKTATWKARYHGTTVFHNLTVTRDRGVAQSSAN